MSSVRNMRPGPIGRFFVAAVMCASLLPLPAARADSFLPVYQSGAGVFETDLAIGDESDDDYTFFEPYLMDVDAHGNIFVLDYKMLHIRKFDPRGRHVRTFSREGEGPGEIGRSTLRMVVTPDDRVIVADYENKRLTEFNADGDYVGDRKFESMVGGMRATADGGFFVYTQDPDFREFTKYNLVLTKYNAAFTRVAAVDSQRVVLMEQHTSGDVTRMVSVPYVDQFHWEMSPDGGVVVCEPGDYRVRILSPRLETVHVITRDAKRAPVTDANRREFLEDAGDAYADIARGMNFPKQKPYVSGVLVDHEGYILVCRYDEEDSDTHYDVFSPQGEFVGGVVLPASRQFKVIKHGFVYGVETFEEELPQVRRYRLVPEENAPTEKEEG